MSNQLQSFDPIKQAITKEPLAGVLEMREAQNVQIAMLAAKRFPRDEKSALDRVLNSCCRESLASVAIYQFVRGGNDIQGPSIRLAEAIAQHWGNIESGWREIARFKGPDGVGISVIEAFAWDLESNYRVPRTFNVRHWRDTRNGGYAIADERDIYELCANQAARRVRACLLAVIPGDIVEEAQRQCDTTLAAKADTSPEAQKKIVAAFEPFGVSKAQIEARIQRRLDAITAAQVVNLRKILASLKDGMSIAADWFEAAKEEKTAAEQPDFVKPEAKAKATGKQAEKRPEPPAQEKPAAKPQPEPEPAEKTLVDRKDEALASIEESINHGFDEPIPMQKFEAMLRKQNLLSATGTIRSLAVEKLENIAASVANIVSADEEGGAQ